MNRISVLIRVKLSPSLFARWPYNENAMTVYSLEEGHCQNLTMLGTLISDPVYDILLF